MAISVSLGLEYFHAIFWSIHFIDAADFRMTDARSNVKTEEPEDPVEQMLTKTGCIEVCCEIRVEDMLIDNS